ncbi:MAG: HAMP domain-containing histidine kinase [Chloroflexi bacterium]|nr:HAMP domain-containing histidine kinase [Chloroflexota bacterium]
MISGALAQNPANLQTALHDCHQHLERVTAANRAYAAELRTVSEHMKELDDLKVTFISLVSHELRTPVNILNGFLSIAVDDLAEQLPPEQRKYLETARDNARRLTRIVQELTDFSRLQSGHPVELADPIALGEALAQVVELLSPALASKGLAPIFQLPTDVQNLRYDGESLIVIFRNLLSNAAKFTPPGGNIWVTGARGRGLAAVQIHDTASPIPPEREKAIFEDFRQLENHLTRRYEGLGLGLAVARRTARALSGDINLTVRGSEGNTFTVTLPAG